MSDTIVLTKVFEIGFNEDCKRFNSQATIAFVDTLGNLPKGVKVYFNDIYSGDNLYKVSSEKLVQDISVKIKLDPELGKQSLFGSIVLISDDIDIINESSMDGAEVLIGNWKAEQKIGWPVILWIIWIIIFCILLILSLILFFFNFTNTISYGFSNN